MSYEQPADPYHMLDPRLHTEVSTPEVWEASLNTQPALYWILSSVEEFRAARDYYSGLQESTLLAEAKYLGLDPIAEDSTFVTAHQRLIEDFSTKLRAELPRAKQELMNGLMGQLGERVLSDGTSLRETIEQRLSHITEERLVIDDILRSGKEARLSQSLGTYHAEKRMISAGVLEWLACEELYPGRGIDKFVDHTLKHELLHAAFASATVFDESGALYHGVRNGLRLALPTYRHEQGIGGVYHAQWLNEATIESIRTTITGERSVAYLSEVLLLGTLDALSPGLRDELVIAAIDPEGPSAALAKVEMLLGPTGTGIEDAAEELTILPSRLWLGWLASHVTRCFHRSTGFKARNAYAKAEAAWIGKPAGTYTGSDFTTVMEGLPLGEAELGFTS